MYYYRACTIVAFTHLIEVSAQKLVGDTPAKFFAIVIVYDRKVHRHN